MWDLAARGIAVIGPVPGGLPSIRLPDVSWGDVLVLLPIAASCFVMIMAQSAVAARAFALRHGERCDADADILGLAAAKPGSRRQRRIRRQRQSNPDGDGERAGARSQIAQIAFAGVVALVLLFATAPLQFLPRCVLAPVFTIAVGLVDLKALADIRLESPGEFTLAVATAGRWR